MSFSELTLYTPKFTKEWQEFKLYDLAIWKNGRAFKSKDFSKEGVPIIKIAELKNGITSQTKYTKDSFDDIYALKSNDMLFSWSGSPETSIDIFKYQLDNGWLNQHIFKVISNKQIDQEYLFYLIKYLKPNFIAIAKNKQTTGLGHVTVTDLKKITVKIPFIEEQIEISKILSEIDQKIETNNKINKKLEEMAQAIFKQWFVDFEFPNEDGKPYKSSGGEMVESELGMIPKGWEVTKIGECCKIIRGASPRPIQDFIDDKGMPWLKISDASDSNSKYILNIKEYIKEEGIAKSRKVSEGTLVLSNSATPGIAKIMLTEACVHDGWLIFSEYKNISKEYIYCYLVRERERILTLSNGSVFRNLKTDILKNYPVIIPQQDVLIKATELLISINENIEKNVKENRIIENIRSVLLPKLMSGEIRVTMDN